MMIGCVVKKVSAADAHVVRNGGGNGDGESDTKDGVDGSEEIEIAVAEEENAGCESPKKGKGCEDGVGEVGEGEEERCGANG
jgi:hypothetical protein